jgi:pyrroloquinoline quinone (PQQ) biosynthesis protein C
MSNYEELLLATTAEREAFLAIPIIREALAQGVDRGLYLAYLAEAYHHVKHTCPLLALAASRCGQGDERLRDALFEYIEEEKGHDEWILEDIKALGGDAEAVRRARGGPAARVMVGYAYYAIERISPYALLGMVHVLEGVSATIATQAAQSIRAGIGDTGGGGFSYLESHGSLDQDHVRFFAGLLNGIDSPQTLESIIDTAGIMYRLFGDVFRDLAAGGRGSQDAA